jgi:hypothetical protein
MEALSSNPSTTKKKRKRLCITLKTTKIKLYCKETLTYWTLLTLCFLQAALPPSCCPLDTQSVDSSTAGTGLEVEATEENTAVMFLHSGSSQPGTGGRPHCRLVTLQNKWASVGSSGTS